MRGFVKSTGSYVSELFAWFIYGKGMLKSGMTAEQHKHAFDGAVEKNKHFEHDMAECGSMVDKFIKAFTYDVSKTITTNISTAVKALKNLPFQKTEHFITFLINVSDCTKDHGYKQLLEEKEALAIAYDALKIEHTEHVRCADIKMHKLIAGHTKDTNELEKAMDSMRKRLESEKASLSKTAGDAILKADKFKTALEEAKATITQIKAEKAVKAGNIKNQKVLSDEDVAVIRSRSKAGERDTIISKDFNVSTSTINRCVTGQTYKHLPL